VSSDYRPQPKTLDHGSHVALLKDLTTLGKELGYKDAELNKWVTAQFKIADDKAVAEQQRGEEAAKTAEEKAKIEQQHEYDRARAAKEREEQRAAREEDRLTREEQRKHDEMKAQMEIKRMELQLWQARLTRRVQEETRRRR